jgi:hypothetical protein
MRLLRRLFPCRHKDSRGLAWMVDETTGVTLQFSECRSCGHPFITIR